MKTTQRLAVSAVAWFIILVIATITLAEETTPQADEVDYVALATRMVKDGHFDRAESLLANVDPAKAGVKLDDYWTLRGLVSLNNQNYKDAVESLELAIQNGKIDDIIFVYLAQAYWGLKDYEMTVRSVDNADEEGENIARLQLMKSQALWKLGRHDQAWTTLRAGSKKFTDDREFDRQSIFLLIELGLYQDAVELGNTFVANGANAEDYLALGEALRRNRQFEEAIIFLEKARLLYPDDKRVVVQLAHAHVDTGKPLTGADLFQRASELDPKFVLEAAELYRRAASFERALYMNAQIDDQRDKFRQRVAILTDMERFEAVAAMQPRLARLKLLDDQPVLYAVAYARFKTADYEGTERLLKKITDPALFQNATQLRKVMAFCAENPSSC